MDWSEKECVMCQKAKLETVDDNEYGCPSCGWRFKVLDFDRSGKILVESSGDYEVWEGVDFSTFEVESSCTFGDFEEAMIYYSEI
jgi:hypothetical protein